MSSARPLRTFSGYARRNGEVGIRNELWIIPTVGCVNGVAERLARMLEKETRAEGIDGIRLTRIITGVRN